MTNPSPPEPRNSIPEPIPERRRRPATGVTFDEMIAMIVAFSTIGTILFWAMGGRNSKLASNFGLGGGTSLLSSNQTSDGVGFGNILSNDADADADVYLRNKGLEAENRRLAAMLQEQDSPVAYIPPNKSVDLPAEVERRSFSLDSGATLVPLTGVAAPALTGRTFNIGTTNNVPEEIIEEEDIVEVEPEATAPETTEVPAEVEPEATAPETTEVPAEVEPTPITPETTQMPDDVAADYWAYPFVKQMRDKALVPELARNQEFEPDTLITRASMATLISQAFEDVPETESIKRFTDVTNGNELAKDIDKAVSTGFMQGYSDTEFKPLQNIPRYQVLVTLATGLDLEPPQNVDAVLQQFGDSSNMPDWARQQVAAATEAGLVVNPPDVPSSSLDPERPATRAEVAAMIHQALVNTGKLEPLESEYIVEPQE